MPAHARYLAALLVAAIGVAAVMVWVVMGLPMEIFKEAYPMYEQVKELTLTDGTEAAGVLVVGDSRAKAALLPELLGPRALSLSLPGGSAIELDYTVERYLRHHPAPARVAVAISSVHFAGGFIFWENATKFRYLDDAQEAEFLATTARLHDDTFGGPIEARATAFFLRHAFPHTYLPELRAALFHRQGGANREMLGALWRDRGHAYFGRAERSDGLSYETGHATFAVTPTYDFYFRRLLGRLRGTGARVVFQAMPINRRSVETTTAAFKDAYRRYFAEVARAFPDIRISAEWPILPDDHFGDANHVNARGAAVVTRLVRDALEM